jgi:hypothetical protein
MTGPPTGRVSTGSAQIREQQLAALKFRSEYVDVLENNRRIEVITQAEAKRRIALGGYEAVGNNTAKYLRRLPRLEGPIDGPPRKSPPRATDNFTIHRTSGNEYHPRFPARSHPWAKAPLAGRQENS